MSWRAILADVIVTVHFGIVSFVLFGLILTLVGLYFRWGWVRNFWFRLAHLATTGIVVIETVFNFPCPLTVWERDLRAAAGQEASEASFVGRLLHNLFIFDNIHFSNFLIPYCLFGAVVLATFVFAPPRWPWRRKTAPATGLAGPHAVASSEPIPR